MQCEDDVITDFECDYATIVSESEYNDANSEGLTFLEANIEGDCLSFKIGASGCDGGSWRFQLIDSGAVAESLPEQRYLKLDFDNNEACLAYFERTVSFDLKPLQIDSGIDKVILHVDGWEQPFTYSY
jgi:hypothetical protein